MALFLLLTEYSKYGIIPIAIIISPVISVNYVNVLHIKGGASNDEKKSKNSSRRDGENPYYTPLIILGLKRVFVALSFVFEIAFCNCILLF